MNMFEQYGIKEVADVTLYSIELNENDDEIYIPVLYMDTLKISNIEQTAEQTSATGGRGNADLITWDYGKEITVTLEDALFTPASMGMIWGGVHDRYPLVIEIPLYFLATQQWVGSKYNEKDPENKLDTKAVLGIAQPSNCFPYPLDRQKKAKIYVTRVDNLRTITNDEMNKEFEQYFRQANGIPDDVDISDYTSGIIAEAGNYRAEGEGFIESEFPEIRGYVHFVISKNSLTLFEDSILTHSIVFNNTIKGYGNPTNYNDLYNVYIQTKGSYNLQDTDYMERMEKCIATNEFCINTDINNLHNHYRFDRQYEDCELTVYIDPKTMQPYESNTNIYRRKTRSCKNSSEEKYIQGQLCVIKKDDIYYKWTRTKSPKNESLGSQIIVDAFHFPGTFKLVGETYVRDRVNGKDQRYQFEIPLCKMGSETSLNLQAEGDPTTFTMTLKVLRKEDGTMMKLTQYKVENERYDGIESSSHKIVPIERMNLELS